VRVRVRVRVRDTRMGSVRIRVREDGADRRLRVGGLFEMRLVRVRVWARDLGLGFLKG